MSKVISLVVILLLTFGLLSYAVFGQVDAIQNTSDKSDIENQKLEMMIDDPNIVTGNSVRNYDMKANNTKGIDSLEVTINNIDKENVDVKEVRDTGVYKMTKKYNEHGKLYEMIFDQIDLKRTIGEVN